MLHLNAVIGYNTGMNYCLTLEEQTGVEFF
jgi:hypothetical protein